MKTTIQESSGNVFADLGFEPEEALNLRVRSDLMIEISKLIEERGLTQTAAAELLKSHSLSQRSGEGKDRSPQRGQFD